jgi:predicted transglutaminase-like cysteine proteinase
MSKRFGLSLMALACTAVLGLAEPAAAIDGMTAMHPYTSAREGSATARHHTGDALFGMQTAPATGDLSWKWRAVEAEIVHEETVLAACRAAEACPAPAQDLLQIAAQGAGRTGLARVGLINRAVNLAIKPTSDESQWGIADHWSAPFETLQTHRGDCEDYAILKYAALLEAGLSRDDLKIVVFRNLVRNEDHAVLVARVDGDWRILDNRNLVLVRHTELVGAHPMFVLDQDGAHRLVSLQQAD